MGAYLPFLKCFRRNAKNCYGRNVICGKIVAIIDGEKGTSFEYRKKETIYH